MLNRKCLKKRRFSLFTILMLSNLLLAFTPMLAFLAFGSFERSLLDSLEQSLAQQGRLLAAQLSREPLNRDRAEEALRAIRQQQTARYRIISKEGNLLADSSQLAGAANIMGGDTAWSGDYPGTRRDRPKDELSGFSKGMYDLFSTAFRSFTRIFLPPRPDLGMADFYSAGRGYLSGTEVRQALKGRYGASTRLSAGGQRSVSLYSALPIWSPDSTEDIQGAVLVSQSTYRILRELYKLRASSATIFFWSLLAALSLSLIVGIWIFRPIKRLSNYALAACEDGALWRLGYSTSGRHDEIGELERAFSSFSQRLRERLEWAEGFAADAAHQLRNPIASLFLVSENLTQRGDPGLTGLGATVANEASRMLSCIDGLRQLSRIDASPSQRQPIEMWDYLTQYAKMRGPSWPGYTVSLPKPDQAKPAWALADPERLAMALDCVMENAISFSGAHEEIQISLRMEDKETVIAVRDHGPGIPAEHMQRVFDRFFSYRPAIPSAQSGQDEASLARTDHSLAIEHGNPRHAGIGLAIATSLVASMGARIWAENAPNGGGAVFCIALAAIRPIDPRKPGFCHN